MRVQRFSALNFYNFFDLNLKLLIFIGFRKRGNTHLFNRNYKKEAI